MILHTALRTFGSAQTGCTVVEILLVNLLDQRNLSIYLRQQTATNHIRCGEIKPGLICSIESASIKLYSPRGGSRDLSEAR